MDGGIRVESLNEAGARRLQEEGGGIGANQSGGRPRKKGFEEEGSIGIEAGGGGGR